MTREKKMEIKELHKEKKTISEIATQIGVSYNTVRNFLIRNNLKPNKKYKWDLDEVANFAKDHTMTEIMDKYGSGIVEHIYNRKIPHKYKYSEKINEILKDINAGILSKKKIAEKHNVSRWYVYSIGKRGKNKE